MANLMKLKGIVFTQPQIMLLFSCDPYRNADDIKENAHHALPALLRKDLLEKHKYDDGTTYYEPTIKGWEIIKEYKPHEK